MIPIGLEESALKKFFRNVYDTNGFAMQGAKCVGFVTGVITSAEWFDKIEFRQVNGSIRDFASLYTRIHNAIRYFPDWKICIENDNIIVREDEEGKD